MEDLNKHQLVLLTLLVSFVTSIGTGIITVSLLQEAPPVITSTVNRVVEKTIETVVQGPEVPGKNTETVREVTVVVNQEELVTESIEKNSKSIVRIFENSEIGEEVFYGLGIVSGDSIISARANNYSSGMDYRVLFNDGTETFVTREPDGASDRISVFKLTDGGTYTSAEFGNAANLKLGQSLIVIGGAQQRVVSIGNLASLVNNEESGLIEEIEISLEGNDQVLGAPVINLKGQVVGLRTRRVGASGNPVTYFISIDKLKSELSS